MSDNRLVKLGNLLESKNRTIRNEAAAVIGQIPFSNVHLLPTIRKFLHNSLWDTRVSSADALGRVLAALPPASVQPTDNCGATLSTIDIREVISSYRPLLCSEGEEMNAKDVKVSKHEQRSLIDQHLNMEARIYGSMTFLKDDEIDPSHHAQAEASSSNDRMQLNCDVDVTDIGSNGEIDRTFTQLLVQILQDIANQKWQTRHGGFLALHKIVCISFARLSSKWIEVVSQRVIEVLALDRFVDFATGSNSVAPVREAAAQCLCVILCKIPSSSYLASVILDHLKALLHVEDDKRWQCRQTALIVLKYYFAAGEPSEKFSLLISDVLLRMSDVNDEVVSAAIVALASLFSNSKLLPEKCREWVNKVMASVWQKFRQPECLKQLRDGVDSVLTDLIGIVNVYAQVESSSNLNDEEFRTFVDLLDPRLIARTLKVLQCLGISLTKTIETSDSTLYQLLKMLFRCCLFAPPSEGAELLDSCLVILLKLLEVFPDRFGSLDALHKSIGYWISCLMSDDKYAEIDVFALCVEGPSSDPISPNELMCGTEICAVSETDRPNIILERKIVLARFLSPIVNALYRSGKVIGEQPVHISIQLIFYPYLRSTILSQRFGAALMLNCWARMFRRQAVCTTDLASPLIFPDGVVAEAMNALNCSPESFNDVLISVQNLTNECNDFTKYCRRFGAKSEDIPEVRAIDNLEEFTTTAFHACMKYCKSHNVSQVKARYDYITHLIASTKDTIRISANRVNALLASSIFYFNYAPAKLTPMIRPLMESAENEDQIKMAEETLFDSFPIMLLLTASRDPCPHSKITKQICTGLLASAVYTPPLKNWIDRPLTIIGSLHSVSDKNLSRARNSELVLRACFSHLADCVLSIWKELNNYLKFDVDMDDVESTLLNFEVVRTVFQQWRVFPAPTQIDGIVDLMRSSNAAARYRVSRCLLELAKVDLFETMNLFYSKLVVCIADINDDGARAGVAEFILLLTSLEEKLVGATSLLAPLAFSAISDTIEPIREAAATSFRKMVTILPLEKDESQYLIRYSPTISQIYRDNLNFLNVLSAPGSLPLLTKDAIPSLNPAVFLREYQLEGITWMMFLHKFGLNGILADDMGLGKTLQTLCLLSIIHNGNSSTDQQTMSLIVCPKTLINHWCNEWLNYFPGEKRLRKVDEVVDADSRVVAPIVVASYDELRHHQVLRDRRWRYIILDEGHCIRNHTTQLFEVISNLISKHRLILSGTPVQNSPADLWALFRFLMPGYLSTRSSFHQKYIKPMLACRNPKASDHQTKEGEEALSLLHRQVLPFLLRRLKTDVLDELPEKVVQDCLCQLTDAQKALYTAVVDRCSLMREKKKEEDQSSSLSALHTLISLRKLVDHPLLIADVIQKLDLKDIFDVKSKMNHGYELSGKLIALKEILEECQIGKEKVAEAADAEKETSGVEVPSINSHRALIFCQWRASVEMLTNYLDNGGFGAGISYLRLDGSVAPGDRQAVVDQFNQDESIDLMILTTHIGGVGLNLTGADVVIFLDHDWNPVKDLQAIDRAHRLGQKKTVNVYRLITEGSIEEKIMRYQKFKSDTANVLVGADNRSLGSMAADELLELFALGGNGKEEASVASTSKEDDEAPKTKRRKTRLGASNVVAANVPGNEKWSMEELWDNSQYDEQHSVSQFLRHSKI